MRVLSCLMRSYYGDPAAVNPFYHYFVDIPRRMGHQALHFDHAPQARLGKDAMNDLFLSTIRGGHFDCLLVEMVTDEFYPEVLDEAKRLTCTVAFNSDDDWRWLSYSASWAPHFSYSVTTYRHIYEAARATYPNLLLSAWACPGFYDSSTVAKDIDVSFVGAVYGDRQRQMQYLRKHRVPIKAFGHGSQRSSATYGRLLKLIASAISGKLLGRRGAGKGVTDWLWQRLDATRGWISVEEINAVWKRSRIALALLKLGDAQMAQKLDMAKRLGKAEPTGAWNPWTSPLQVKSRVFELGTTGTLMLCDRNPELDEYYERGKEYEDFESDAECVEKIRFYLGHEDARRRIAQAYYDRTKREHMWEQRLQRLFSEIGLPR